MITARTAACCDIPTNQYVFTFHTVSLQMSATDVRQTADQCCKWTPVYCSKLSVCNSFAPPVPCLIMLRYCWKSASNAASSGKLPAECRSVPALPLGAVNFPAAARGEPGCFLPGGVPNDNDCDGPMSKFCMVVLNMLLLLSWPFLDRGGVAKAGASLPLNPAGL